MGTDYIISRGFFEKNISCKYFSDGCSTHHLGKLIENKTNKKPPKQNQNKKPNQNQNQKHNNNKKKLPSQFAIKVTPLTLSGEGFKRYQL